MRLDWERDGGPWPNRESSRFVTVGSQRWHVQVAGTGPTVLLLHGTGASTHSWRGLLPLLSQRFTVVAPDLPGHGFSSALPAPRDALRAMSDRVAGLLEVLGTAPSIVVGHSAGAAIALRGVVDGRVSPAAIVGINAALLPFTGLPSVLFAPAARLLATQPLVARLLAWRAHHPSAVERVISGTGSRLDAAGIEGYGRVIRSPGHVAGALAMMAGWNLESLVADFARLDRPLWLVVGENDRAVSPAEASRVIARIPNARRVSLPRLGHLAHEEDPATVAEVVVDVARNVGCLPAE